MIVMHQLHLLDELIKIEHKSNCQLKNTQIHQHKICSSEDLWYNIDDNSVNYSETEAEFVTNGLHKRSSF